MIDRLIGQALVKLSEHSSVVGANGPQANRLSLPRPTLALELSGIAGRCTPTVLAFLVDHRRSNARPFSRGEPCSIALTLPGLDPV